MWVKVSTVLEHASKFYHVNALADGASFMESIRNPHTTICAQLNAEIAQHIE